MSVSYKKLWHILLDRDMKKKDLAAMAGLTPYMMKKLTRDEPVTTEVIGKICTSLSCRADDILEFCNDYVRFNGQQMRDNQNMEQYMLWRC